MSNLHDAVARYLEAEDRLFRSSRLTGPADAHPIVAWNQALAVLRDAVLRTSRHKVKRSSLGETIVDEVANVVFLKYLQQGPRVIEAAVSWIASVAGNEATNAYRLERGQRGTRVPKSTDPEPTAQAHESPAAEPTVEPVEEGQPRLLRGAPRVMARAHRELERATRMVGLDEKLTLLFAHVARGWSYDEFVRRSEPGAPYYVEAQAGEEERRQMIACMYSDVRRYRDALRELAERWPPEDRAMLLDFVRFTEPASATRSRGIARPRTRKGKSAGGAEDAGPVASDGTELRTTTEQGSDEVGDDVENGEGSTGSEGTP